MFTNISKSRWLKIVLFITTFAFVGTGFVALIVYKLSGNISGAAEVNGDTVSLQEFYFELNQLKNAVGDEANNPSVRKMLYIQALQRVIDRQLLYQFAKEEGIQATDLEAKAFVAQIPAFQTNGKFDPQKLKIFLQAYNISPAFFQEVLKKQLSVSHVDDLLNAGVYLTNDEVESVIKDKLSKLYGKAVLITPKVSISDSEIKSYYEKNKNKFLKSQEQLFKVYRFSKDQQQEVQKVYSTLKAGKQVNVNPAFEGSISEIEKKLPAILVKELEKAKSQKIVFLKDKNGYYILVKAGTRKTVKPLNEVKGQIVEALKQEKQQKQASQIAKRVKSIAEAKNLKEVNIKEFNIEGKTPLELKFLLGLSDKDLEKLLKKKQGVFLTPQGVVIVKLDKIAPPDKTLVSKLGIKDMLLKQKLSDELSMLVDKLRGQSDIKINKRLLNQ